MMPALLVLAGWIVTAAALAGALYSLFSAHSLSNALHAPNPQPPDFPAVTLLKPLYGAEAGLEARLSEFCAQDYPAPVQIVFGVQAADDAAVAVVNAVKAKYPALDTALVVGTPRDNANPKIANLTFMVSAAKHGIVVVSDSDIGVPRDYLRHVVSALRKPGIGVATCYYAGAPNSGLWARLTAMGIDYQFLPNAAFAVGAGLGAPCFGSTIALETATLRNIGGFEAFLAKLADDYEIGRTVRGLGLGIAYPPIVLTHACTEKSIGEMLRHELRWARTIRGIDPVGHAGSLVTHPLALSLLGALMLGPTPESLTVIGVALGARTVQKLWIDRILARQGPPLWLIPLRDMLSFAVFVGAYFTKQVDWRGLRYRVDSGGDLTRD
jgi:ceramide glucosyltransferase